MALDALGYAASRIRSRSGDVFAGEGSFTNPFSDPDNDMLYSLGAVRNIKVTGTKRMTSEDSHGRRYQKGVDLEVTWEVMQTDYSVEMQEIPDLISADNIMLKITDNLVTAARGATDAETAELLSEAAHAADGIEFDNAKLELEFELDFGDEDSVFTITMMARLSMAQVRQLGNAPIVLGG